jgi:eukaryotic-like serine/threonine-protein kinase
MSRRRLGRVGYWHRPMRSKRAVAAPSRAEASAIYDVRSRSGRVDHARLAGSRRIMDAMIGLDDPRREGADTETILVHPAASTDGIAASSTPLTSSGVTSPLEALARDEVLRTRNYCFMSFGIFAGGLAAVPFLPSGYYETRLFLIGIAIGILGMVYLLHRTRDPATFHHGSAVTICWFVSAAGVNTAVPYFGPYSPVPILLLMGIYFVGLGQSRVLAVGVYAQCAVVQAATASLAVVGVAEPGIMRADYLNVEAQLLIQALVQMILAAAFFISRASRRVSLAALTELQAAIRAVAQREALLEEAKEELRRALVGGRGRFSEQTIGNYDLGELLGRGAMGEVYEGTDARTGQAVAVKMLVETSLGNADHVRRFLRELRTARMIDSANVVRVLDVAEQPLPHLVMERLDGRDLSAILRDEQVLSIPAVVDLLQQLGSGITAAASLGIVHRDLKPQNVFLEGTTWKILDFGVSRLADTSDTLTAGQVIGTPVYMAPEQARGARVDSRADLYALAAIAYRCLTGYAPFSSGEVAEVIYRVVHTAPRRPSSLAQLPEDVDHVLAIGLAKRPDERFATAAELAAAMAQAVAGHLPESIRERARAIDSPWESKGMTPRKRQTRIGRAASFDERPA